MKQHSLGMLAAVVLMALGAQAGADDGHGSASFALIGDVPYGAAVETKFDNVIASINAARQVRFVVHTGDVKAGSERCDDALLQKRFNQFQTFRDGVIVTPGDND
jgi:hypothetical protein